MGHPQHCRAVTSFPFREGFLSPVRGTERIVKPIEGRFSKKPFLLVKKDGMILEGINSSAISLKQVDWP